MLVVTPDKSSGTGLGILILALRADVGRLGLWPNVKKHFRMSGVGLGLVGLEVQVPMVMVMVMMVVMVVLVRFLSAEHESVVVDMVVLMNVVVDLCASIREGSDAFRIFPGITATNAFHMTGLGETGRIF